MKLTSRVVPVAAILLAAGTASAATFSFTNTLGNGLWFSEAQTGPTWFNNWGQSGPASGLPLPGASDIANLAGTVNGNGNIAVTTINSPAGVSFTHTGSSIAAAFSNSGTFGFTGGNRTFSGTWTNNASGIMTFGDGAGWTFNLGGMSLANAGTVNLPGGASANGGTWSSVGTIDKNAGGGFSMNSPVISATSGMIMASNGTLTINSPTVTSFPAATWVTTAGGAIRLSSPTMSGTFVGNHNGLGAIAGSPSLAANTTLTNSGAGTQPWVRETGSISTGAFTMTNAGNLLVAGGNQNLTGTFVNSGTLTLDPNGWTYNLAAASSISNAGLIVLNGGHNLNGAAATSVLNNSGAMTKANGGGTTINSLTFNNNAGGSVNAPNGGISLNSARVSSSPSAVWTSANNGAVAMNSPTVSGTFNGTGARFDLNSPVFASNTTFAGTSGGQWNLRDGIDLGGFTVTNTGSAALASNGGNTFVTNGVMVNGTGATWAVGNGSGWTSNFNGATWTNNGLITIDGGHNLNRNVNPFVVNNNGTLRRDAGGTVSFNDASFNHVGAINHAPSTTGLATTFNNGTFVAGPSSSFTIPVGAVNLNSATISGTFNANLNGGSGNINSPTLAGNATLNATGAQPWNVTGGVNTGAFTLTNIAQGGFNIGGGNTTLTGTFVNTSTGTMLFSNGSGWTMTLDNAVLNNAGTMNVPGGFNINKGTNAATFSSTGTLNRTSGGSLALNSLAATLSSNIVHDSSNPGTVFNNGSVVSNNAVYTIPSGSFGFSGASISGTFNGVLTGGDGYFNNCVLTGNVTLNTTGAAGWDLRGGTTSTGYNLTNNGVATFARGGGNATLSGNFVNAASGNVRFSNGSGWTFTLANSTVTNNGAMSVPGGFNINGAGASTVLSNNGTFTHDSGGSLVFNSMTVNNSGLITNAGGAVTGFNSSSITQTGSGVIRTPAGTRTTFSSTSVSGGRIEGTGNINSNGLTLSGARLAPGDVTAASVGTLTCDGGNVTFGPGSSLQIDLDRPNGNPPQVADQFRTTVFNQTVNLNGAELNVRLPSGYTPNFNVEYVIVDVQNGGTLTGTFGSVTEANPLPGYGYRLTYTSNQVKMKVVRQCNLSDVSGPNQVPLFDGAATADDIIVFLGWYFANDLRADFAGPNQTPGPNGQLTADDIIVFLGLYFQGCGF